MISLTSSTPKFTSSNSPQAWKLAARPPSYRSTNSQLMVDRLVGWSISWSNQLIDQPPAIPAWTTKQFITSLNSDLPRARGPASGSSRAWMVAWDYRTWRPWVRHPSSADLGCWCRHINGIHRIVASLDAILDAIGCYWMVVYSEHRYSKY